MDDLEEVWGPRGRATLDPTSVRPIVTAPVAPAGTSPLTGESPLPPGPPRPTASLVLNGPGPDGAILPASTSGARLPHLVWIAAGGVAVVVAVLVLALAARSSDRPAPVATNAGATATTIVSAAADLLGRGGSTTTEPAASTRAPATSTAAPSTAPQPTAPPATAPPATAPSRFPAVTPPPSGSAETPPLAHAERAAQQFIDVLARRDCDGLWAMLSRETQAFLESSTEPGARNGRDELCDGLREEETIPPMRVHGPAEARGDRAVVPLESEGEVENLTFVAEDGRWLIDLFGEFAEES